MVTGTASPLGIGWGIALALAKGGADVAVCDIVSEGGGTGDLAQEIRKLGRRALALHADLTRPAKVQETVQKVLADFGTIDILANNAGGGDRPQPGVQPRQDQFLEMSLEDWDRVFDNNFTTCLLVSQAVGKVMRERRRGSIINTSSIAGEGRGGATPYGVAKAAINKLTKGMAHDLAKYNIRVNAIQPAWTRTEVTRRMWDDADRLKAIASLTPLGRMVEPSDIGSLARFLASDDSSFITGVCILVDGGASLPSIHDAPGLSSRPE